MNTIVCNASPLIVLAKAQYLEILPKLFAKVLVPQAVSSEIEAGPFDDPMRNQIHHLSWLDQVQLEPELTPLAYWQLGRGESEVIEYARQHPATIALVDDRRARRAASAMGIPVCGTLGVLAMSVARLRSFSFEDAVKRLRESGLYVNENVVEAVRREL